MKLPWQNPQNPHVTPENYKISPQHTPIQRFVIAVFVILLFPIMLVVYPIGKLIGGAFMLAGQVGFYLGEACFRKPNKEARYRGQWLRAWINSQASALPHINTGFRKFLYRLSGLNIGKAGFIGMGGILEDLHPENVVIEDNVTMSFGCTIIAHGPKRNITRQEDKMVILRQGAYVGARTTFIPGVEVGHHATIGAGSVVTKSVPAGAVVAGCPARILYYKEGYGPEAEQNAAATR
ncbi:MAG: acyltransferase [Ruminococcaceae bacterium]|nr:acyltransferase [Oscillospiraceae bacterium]